VTVKREDLVNLAQHWAVAALGEGTVEIALAAADAKRVREAVGQHLRLSTSVLPDEDRLIERVALAFELAASESLNELAHPSLTPDNAKRALAQAGAFRAYELRSVLPVPTEHAERIFHVLHLSALAYCGERWTDLKHWYRDHANALQPLPADHQQDWSGRLLSNLFDCWVRLFRKSGWDDLGAIAGLIATLRTDQAKFEPEYLAAVEQSQVGTAALRLLSFYHWARASEQLSLYVLQGEPRAIDTELDTHFEAAYENSVALHDAALEVMLRWLHAASRRMVSASVWWVAHTVNSRVARFVESAAKSRSMFELLPTQRVALQEQGLLDPAARAIVVELPTSGGKTALAQLRILQALNQFESDNGWVAYVAPTRALVSQIARRFRREFKPIGVEVEQLSAAVDTDAFEERLLSSSTAKGSFHILIATPEKLHSVIRNKKITRPLALVVMDEAQNIEDPERGLRIELLLATIKLDCPTANFLLLMPYVPNAQELAQWLAPDSGRTISLGTTAWRPNDRVVGMYQIVQGDHAHTWGISFETLTTTPGTIHLDGLHSVGDVGPLSIPYSKAKGPTRLTGAIAKVFSDRGTSIGVGRTIDHTWTMARTISADLAELDPLPPEIALTQRFLRAEVSPSFELIGFLARGVGVHHAGLSDETRSLVEWLTEEGLLRVLCATTTIAQGINFPVSSVFLASRMLPSRGSPEMSARAFWNLAGRAGRLDQSSIGIVGLASGDDPNAIRKYVSSATTALVSRLVSLLDDIEDRGRLGDLALLIKGDEWADFRSYVAHLWCEKKNLDAVVAESEQLLRNTFGYGVLQSRKKDSDRRKARALLEATKKYASELAANPASATLADATGFSPEGVRAALGEMSRIRPKLDGDQWNPGSIFGSAGTGMLANLVGIMMRIPQIKGHLEELGKHGTDRSRVAEIAQAWVNGQSIEKIASAYFQGPKNAPFDLTDSITAACKGIYKTLAYAGTWGLAALAKLPTSGIDFDQLSDVQRREIGSIPAMLYHGVKTEAAVLMRMNAVPRTISERLGSAFEKAHPDAQSPSVARSFLRELQSDDWSAAAPPNSAMSGEDYQSVWRTLSGE
jgi:hypothetical protein